MVRRYTSRFQALTGFRHDHERKNRRRKQLIAIAFFILLIIIFRSPLEGILARAVHVFASPFFRVSSLVLDSFSETRAYFLSKQTLQDENVRLKDALDVASLTEMTTESLVRENRELKKVFGRHKERTLLLARVLVSPGSSPYDTLIIDTGSALGVAEGTPVLVDGDFIIGEVSRVYGESAVVTLYSSSGNELPVTVGSSSVPTTAFGVGGGNFRIVLPRGIFVGVGDVVEIPSLSPLYLGVVDAISKPTGGSLQEIYFKWPMNIYTLRYVYLATGEHVRNANDN